MKKTLLALALLAFTGTTAFAHEGHDKDGKNDKKGKKKEACSAEAKAHCSKEGTASLGGTPSCCMKKGAKASAVVTPAPALTPATKSL
jgi:hypothetical protein